MIQETPKPAIQPCGRWIPPAAHGLRLVAMLAVCRVPVGGVAWAGEDGTRARHLEANLKVDNIYDLPKFIEWPGGGTVAEPTKICVPGTDAVGVMLDELSDGKVKEWPTEAAHLERVEIPTLCHLLCISRSAKRQVSFVLRRIQGTQVLAARDVPRFAHEGGMIGFAIDGDRVKVEPNQRIVREAGPTIRAKLVEVARIVP